MLPKIKFSMEKEYRFILQPYTGRNSRFTCPKCHRPHEFTRYIDRVTGEILDEEVGKCNRLDKCGYHYTPKQYFENNGKKPTGIYIPKLPPVKRKVSYIRDKILDDSLKDYHMNDFIKYLVKQFGKERTDHLIDLYYIGTSKRYDGATVFWQVDIDGRIRTGKIIKYDDKGHRVKHYNNWVHTVLKLDNFNLKQCFFGEHILKNAPHSKVALVESEKTAIIASAIYPDFIWLATGGAEGINDEKVKVLNGRTVILFPDSSKDGRMYQKWKKKAIKYGFEISDYLEKNATTEQKANGFDIADMMLMNEQPQTFPKEPDIKPEPDANRNEFKSGAVVEPKLKHEDEYEIPYNTPSPAAIIDSKILNPPIFEGHNLVIKNRVFTSIHGDKIELVGVKSYGYCGNWQKHKEANGYCKACLLNTVHTIKINGKLQNREYSQLEVLILQG